MREGVKRGRRIGGAREKKRRRGNSDRGMEQRKQVSRGAVATRRIEVVLTSKEKPLANGLRKMLDKDNALGSEGGEGVVS